MITAKRHYIYDEKKERKNSKKIQQSMWEVYNSNSHDTNTLANQEHVN